MRRLLLNAEIPSARARQEVQDILRIQREQNRLGGLLKKALTERAEKAMSFAAPSSKSSATELSSGASSPTLSAPDDHHAQAATERQDPFSSVQARPLHASGQRERSVVLGTWLEIYRASIDGTMQSSRSTSWSCCKRGIGGPRETRPTTWSFRFTHRTNVCRALAAPPRPKGKTCAQNRLSGKESRIAPRSPATYVAHDRVRRF